MVREKELTWLGWLSFWRKRGEIGIGIGIEIEIEIGIGIGIGIGIENCA